MEKQPKGDVTIRRTVAAIRRTRTVAAVLRTAVPHTVAAVIRTAILPTCAATQRDMSGTNVYATHKYFTTHPVILLITHCEFISLFSISILQISCNISIEKVSAAK